MTTLAEHWKTEGRLEGEARGRLEGARVLLLSQLELKFGALASQERAIVTRASDDELARWAVKVLTATSIADVLET